jgi:uncharacterized delta-60 repeat protein
MEYIIRNFLRIFIILLTFSFLSLSITANSVDPSFSTLVQTSRFRDGTVYFLVALPDGKMLAGGYFNSYNGQKVGGLIRLNPDASLDTTFNNRIVVAGTFPRFAPLLDGKILLFGTFDLENGLHYQRKVVRLNADGTIDDTFQSAIGGLVSSVASDLTGKIIVGGPVEVNVNGIIEYKKLVRLNEDGSIDPSFNPIALQRPCGIVIKMGTKIVCETYEPSTGWDKLLRFNEDGSIDSTFQSTFLPETEIRAIKGQSDGKILVLSPAKVRRINENGELEAGFQVDFSSNHPPNQMHILEDGRFVVSTYGGSIIGQFINRYLSDGTIDNSFSQYHNTLSLLGPTVLDPEGGVIVSGDNMGFAPASNQFIRLAPNGNPDPSFNAGESGFQWVEDGKVQAIVLLPDQKILIGGDFDRIGGVAGTWMFRFRSVLKEPAIVLRIL